MAIDPSNFFKLNVIDTCSIWNILSSRLLYSTSLSVKCSFSCTYFVYYECLYKPRQNSKPKEIELQNRFRKEHQNGQFKEYHLELEDLQDIELLRQRKKISMGELSSIAFAQKTRQAFMTDDQPARRLAEKIIEDKKKIQTVPHLLGWLYFENYLSDGDIETVIQEHKEVERPLEPFFREMYRRALQYRSISQ